MNVIDNRADTILCDRCGIRIYDRRGHATCRDCRGLETYDLRTYGTTTPIQQTVTTLRRPPQPPIEIASDSTHCANNHEWKAETTRWRFRDRSHRTDGRASAGWERDCLVCKEMADKARRAKRAGRATQLIVDVTESGTHWGTRGAA